MRVVLWVLFVGCHALRHVLRILCAMLFVMYYVTSCWCYVVCVAWGVMRIVYCGVRVILCVLYVVLYVLCYDVCYMRCGVYTMWCVAYIVYYMLCVMYVVLRVLRVICYILCGV